MPRRVLTQLLEERVMTRAPWVPPAPPTLCPQPPESSSPASPLFLRVPKKNCPDTSSRGQLCRYAFLLFCYLCCVPWLEWFQKKTVRLCLPAFSYFAMSFYDVLLVLRTSMRMVPKKLSAHAAPRTVISLCLFSCEHSIIIIPSRGVFIYRKQYLFGKQISVSLKIACSDTYK